MLGHFDVASFELREGLDLAFEMPADARPLPLAQAAGARVIPLEQSLAAFGENVRPAMAGLRYLKGLGFSNIFVHSVQPMPVEGEALARNALSRNATAPRYAAMILFNYVLERACAGAGVTFLDVWDDLTEGGLLRGRFRPRRPRSPQRESRAALDAPPHRSAWRTGHGQRLSVRPASKVLSRNSSSAACGEGAARTLS